MTPAHPRCAAAAPMAALSYAAHASAPGRPRFALLLALLAALLGHLAAAPARADNPSSVRVAVTVQNNRIRMVDELTGRLLIDYSRDHPIWTPSFRPLHQPIEPVIDIAPRPDGFDLTAVYTNPTDKVRALGNLSIPGLRFGQVIQTRFFFNDGVAYPIDSHHETYYGGGNVYPGTIYSPIAIVGDDEYTIGVSFIYPIMDYKHKVWVQIELPDVAAEPDTEKWQVRCELNPSWVENGYSPEGELAPGETRTYRIAVRAMRRSPADHPQAWLRLFEPYRLFYQATYGPVAYLRDPRPVLAAAVAYVGDLAPDNTYGFAFPSLRPDLYGWEPWVTRLRNFASTGWERFMLWAPTGLFYQNRAANYPWQFTTAWQREPLIRDTLGLLASFGHETPELGLWWGHSADYMARWDPISGETFNPDNPIHLAAALEELDGAESVNAVMIGLDTFTRIHEWRSIPYLEFLHQRYPKMRFLAEPMPCDILHRVAAGYILVTRPQAEIGFQIQNPHYLADFLNPGHEIWGGVHEGDIKEALGLPNNALLTREQLFPVLRRYAQMGYVIVPFTEAPLNEDADSILAARSWEFTLPGPPVDPEAPVIDLHPVDVVTLPGRPVIFSARAEGSDNTYRWRRNGAFITNRANIDGADTPQLRLDPAIGGDGGAYDVVVSNFLGQAVSRTATLSLVCYTDFNEDNVVNPDDLADFIAGFNASPQDPRCDFNRDAAIDPDDLADYINAYFFGC